MFSFLYHFQRLLSELTVYMSNTVGVLSEAGTAYPSRALELSPVFFVKSVLLFFVVFLRWSIMCFNVLSSVLWCPLRFPHKKRCSVSLYFQLFVVALMSYLRYLCLLTCSGVQHIFCCLSSLLCPMLPISLDCPSLIITLISPNVYL
jgi:hypothetical protein